MFRTPAGGLRAPFPYFGGKSMVARRVWAGLGKVENYVEPFFGSGAVLLGRPDDCRPAGALEVVNDADGLLCNVWRAIQWAPDEVARWADWPANENDLHARHAWLVGQRAHLTERLEGDPLWFNAQAAGWWLWGAANWIGGGWGAGVGPWRVVDGRLVRAGGGGLGVKRRKLSLGSRGRGVRGYQRREAVGYWLQLLSARLQGVQVVSGDWRRVVTPVVLTVGGRLPPAQVGIFLDPPYETSERYAHVYACEANIAVEVARWAAALADYRIVYAGYAGGQVEAVLAGWRTETWSAQGGMGLQGAGTRGRANRHRETLWFSPACELATRQLTLFGAQSGGPNGART